MTSTAGHGRKDRDLVTGPNGRFGAGQIVIDGKAHGAFGRKLARPDTSSHPQPCPEVGDRADRGRGIDPLLGGTECFAQAREIDEVQNRN
jgi:hypothetical protein